MIWKRPAPPAELNRISEGNMLSHLGIVFTAVEPEQLIATMPVDERTKQPHGLLHGGASVVLAESLGSVAGYLCSEGDETVVGVEINANHVRAVRNGVVTGYCKAIHLSLIHISEPTRQAEISYAVFCLKKKKKNKDKQKNKKKKKMIE